MWIQVGSLYLIGPCLTWNCLQLSVEAKFIEVHIAHPSYKKKKRVCILSHSNEYFIQPIGTYLVQVVSKQERN